MNIKKYIAPVSSISDLLTLLLFEQFNIPETVAKELANNSKLHFDNLLDSLYVFAESNYIDKVYRDSYYHYYSSKKNSYNRFCIRLSLFDGHITANDFKENIVDLKRKYRGFIILRPTEPSIIGRSVISPKCLKNGQFISCFTTFNSEAGFGSKIYSKKTYSKEFYQLISTYISSGIPVLCAIDNFESKGKIGHAILCIGHRSRSNVQIERIPALDIDNNEIGKLVAEKNIEIYDWSQAEIDFIFMDDNFPAYQPRPLSKPALGYIYAWKDCEITHAVVPLHTKIYLEAYLARGFVFKFLLMGPVPLMDNTKLLIRFFLTSSRSFKENISLNKSLNPDLKDIILEYVMPQYVWIAELTDKKLIRQKNPKANGIIILDATEANIDFNKPLILAAYQGKVIVFDNSRQLEAQSINIEPFDIFTDNLKPLS